MDSEPSFVEPYWDLAIEPGAPGKWPDETSAILLALVVAASTRCNSDLIGIVPLVRIRVNREVVTPDWPIFDDSPDPHAPADYWSHVELVGECDSADGDVDNDYVSKRSGSVCSDDEPDEEYTVAPEEEFYEEEFRALREDQEVDLSALIAGTQVLARLSSC